MITYHTGNILNSSADALVNPVNCVGVMGKGLALQFKKAFPELNQPYRKACYSGDLQPGRLHSMRVADGPIIINFPTKRHWSDNSRYEDIVQGLRALNNILRTPAITSIAIPPLGCGLGGLDWSPVHRAIVDELSSVPRVAIHIYGQCPS